MIHLIERDNSTVAYHRETGDVYDVTEKYQLALRKLVQLNFASCQNSNPIEAELREIFPHEGRAKAVIDDKAIDEKFVDYLKVCQRATLILTHSCNLRCRYCYENSPDLLNPFPETSPMSVETIKDIIDFLLKTYTSVKTLMFFGGEPLLYFPLIQETCQIIKEKTMGSPGFFQNLGLITNGTLLTEEMALFFKKEGIKVTLSCDGPEKLHDSWRRNAKNEGTWLAVRNAAQILNKHEVGYSIQATLTPDHCNEDCGPAHLSRLFKEWGVIQPHVVHMQAPKKWDDTSIQEIVELYVKDVRKNIQAIEHRNFNEIDLFSRFSMIIQAFIKRDGSPFRCPAGAEVAFDPVGNIFPCFMFAGHPELRVGNIIDNSANKYHEKIRNIMKHNLKLRNTECDSCWASRLCNGCMGANYAMNGDFESNDRVNCGIVKGIAEAILVEFSRLQQEDGAWSKFVTNWHELNNGQKLDGAC